MAPLGNVLRATSSHISRDLSTSLATENRQPRGAGKSHEYRRHKKVLRDNIRGITKPAIRRLARRGGVRRISGDIYEQIRATLKTRLRLILEHVALVVDSGNRKIVTVRDVVWVLNKMGSTIYGFPQM